MKKIFLIILAIILFLLTVSLIGGIFLQLGELARAKNSIGRIGVVKSVKKDLAQTIEVVKEKITGNTIGDRATDGESQQKPDFSFAILGDTQYFNKNNPRGSFQKAAQAIKKKDVAIVMSTGDLIGNCSGNDSCDKKLEDWKKVLGGLADKTYPTVGNHDRAGGGKADASWQNAFNLPGNGPNGYKELVYSFDFENSHFIVLNSAKPEEHAIDVFQREWLERDLSQNKKDNTFVFFHEPAFPVSSKIGDSLDSKKSERDALWKILDQHGVTAVFSGHEHLHSRKKITSAIFPGERHDIYQFISGNTDAFDHEAPGNNMVEYFYKGNDFEVVEVRGKEITMNVYSISGKLLDSFSFSK